jgi:hypothetical protein
MPRASIARQITSRTSALEDGSVRRIDLSCVIQGRHRRKRRVSVLAGGMPAGYNRRVEIIEYADYL